MHNHRSGPSEVIICDRSSQILLAQVGAWIHDQLQSFFDSVLMLGTEVDMTENVPDH